MSLLNKASLIQIPSGYKDGTLYSAKPTNGDGDFTFSRGSNLAATRVNSEGLIEKGRENLLLQSNSFDTTWIKSNASVTSGQTGYDGSSDAWLQQSTSTFCRLDQNITQTGILTLSAYAKAGTSNFLLLEVTRSGGVFYAWFDLSSGVVGTTSAIDANIESVGNGWYRCSLIGNQTLSGQARLRIADSNGSTVTTTSSNIYIQDAQLEQGLVATDYIETGTTTAQAGILEDMPRLDYSGGASCPSLLLEPQRSNLLEYSEYFDGWSIKSGATATSNSIISPEGLQNASTISATNALTNYIGQNYTFSASTEYSYSVFVKNGTSSKMRLQVYDSSQYSTIEFDQSDSITYSVNLDSYDFVDYGNGWRRVIITFTTSAGAGSGYVQIYPDRNGNNEYLYAYGAMLEEGSYSTSYIPTYGASVTRSQDLTTADTSSFYTDSSEGTLFTELSFLLAADGNYNGWFFWNGSSYHRIVLQRRGDTGRGQIEVRINNTTQASIISPSVITLEDNHKMLIKWDGNVFTFFIDGVNIGSDTSTDTYSGTDLNELASRPAYNAANIKQAILFPIALTDAECIELTTL